MLYATNRFPGGGMTTQYELSFVGGYLDRSHVKAYIEYADLVQTPITLTSANFRGTNTITGLPPVPAGATMVIYRDTPKAPLVDFVNGSRFTEANLDTATRQGAFIAAEGADVTALLPPTDASAYNAATSAVDARREAALAAGYRDSAAAYASVSAGHAATAGTQATRATLAADRAEAASGVGGPVIVVIGDSQSAQQVLLGESWPAVLERQLSDNGVHCVIHNLAINGYTFHKANTLPAFGISTQVQKAVEMRPSVVIVALGFNDSLLAVDGRALGTVKADAAAAFAALRTGLPTAEIIYASEVGYDNVQGSPTGLINAQVLPSMMELPTSGILAGTYGAEMLTNACSATTRTRAGDWASLDAYIRALPQVTGTVSLQVWRAARLGMSGADGLHLTDMGAHFLAGNVYKAFATLPALTAVGSRLSNQNYVWFMDSDNLFDTLLTASGGLYVSRPWGPNAAHASRNAGPYRLCNPDTWHIPSKGAYFSSGLSYTQGTPFAWSLTNVPPNTPVLASINGAAWAEVGLTNSYGQFGGTAILPPAVFTVGTHQIRYKVAQEVHGPVTLTVSAAAGGGTEYTLPTATGTVLGGVKVGAGLSISSGTLTAPVATPSAAGIIQVGTGLTISSGVVTAPVATSSVPGRVKPGTGLAVAADGTLNATGTGGVTEGAWQTISLPAGSVYAGSPAPAYRLVGTTVQLRGGWNMGAGLGAVPNNYALTTLPLGYRPTGIVGMAAAWGGVESGAVTADATGSLKVSLRAGAAFSNPIVFLDGCSFSIN